MTHGLRNHMLAQKPLQLILPIVLSGLVSRGAHAVPVIVGDAPATVSTALNPPGLTCQACITLDGGGYVWCKAWHPEEDGTEFCAPSPLACGRSSRVNRNRRFIPVSDVERCSQATIGGGAVARRVLLHDWLEDERHDGNGTKLEPSVFWKTYHHPVYTAYRYFLYVYGTLLLVGYFVVVNWCAKRQQGEGGFSTKITACCDDCGGCCFGMWCPCVEWGRMAEYIWDVPCKVAGCLYFSCSSSGPARGAAGVGLGLAVRMELRNKMGIPGNVLEDCCIHCFAHGCALCQEWREMHIRREAGTLPPPKGDHDPEVVAMWSSGGGGIVQRSNATKVNPVVDFASQDVSAAASSEDVRVDESALQQLMPAIEGPAVQAMEQHKP